MLIAAVLVSCAAAASAGTPVLPRDTLFTYEAYGADAISVVPVNDDQLPFDRAIRVVRDRTGQFPWDGAVYWITSSGLRSGDLAILVFWVRKLSSVPHTLRVSTKFQLQDPPDYPGPLYASVPVDGSGWHRYGIPFRADQDYPAGNSSLHFFFGSAGQTFEIAGVSLTNFGRISGPIPPRLRPQLGYYYPGRADSNARWRLQALDNIEKHRKAKLDLSVLNTDGSPAAGATVSVQETRSLFAWGSAVDAANIVGSGLSPSDRRHYIDAVLKNFNVVVFENDLKWPRWEEARETALRGLAWTDSHKLGVRGHNLIWPSFDLMPPDCINLGEAALRRRISDHFRDELGTLAGRLYEWDVVNEPYAAHDVQGLIGGVPHVPPSQGVLGHSVIASWYRVARSLDPAAKLFLNDYDVFENFDPTHEAYDVALLKYIKSLGGDVDGFGFQSHLWQSGPVFADMIEAVKDFGPLVGTFGATEFDFTTIDEDLQVDLMTDYLTFVFGQPKFQEFLMWGFWDATHWLNCAPLYNLDWSLKRSGKAFQTLTQKTWRTSATGSTDASGHFAIRAFLGDYSITATVDSKTCSASAALTGDTDVVIRMDCDAPAR